MENCNDSTNTKDHSNSIIVGLPPLPREEDEIEEAVFQKAEEACLAWIDEAAANESDMQDIEATFESLLFLSMAIDTNAEYLQRIAALSTKCSEDFPEIIVSDRHGKRYTKPSQIEQRVKERKSIQLQKRGGHTYRRKQEKFVKKDYRMPPWISRELSQQQRVDFRNGVLPVKVVRDIHVEYEEKCKAKEDYDDRFSNCGHHHRYDARVDTVHHHPYVCLHELQWLLELLLNTDINIDDNYLSFCDGKYTISKPLESHYVIDGISKANEIIAEVSNEIEPNCFNGYSENKYHPLHQHGSIISNIHTKLKVITDDLQKQIDDDISLDAICKYIASNVSPSLKTIAMEIRSNIIIMQKRSNDQNGYYYSKLHAVKVVTTYKKGTSERASAIRHMVNDGWIPNRKALDKLLKLKERGCFFIDDEWNTDRGRLSRQPIKFENERYHSIINHLEEPSSTSVRKKRKQMTKMEKIIDTCMTKTDCEIEQYLNKRHKSTAVNIRPYHGSKYDKRIIEQATRYLYRDITMEVAKKKELLEEKKKEGRKLRQKNTQYSHIGSLLLALHPVKVKRPYEPHYRVYGFQSVPLITTSLYAPPKVIEVGNKLGLSAKRLYFSPKQFPVTDLDNAGDTETFKRLKDYIVEQSLLAGNSPVVFHGTDCGSKRFVCKYTLEKNWKQKFGHAPYTRCKFSFSVKWDTYGYYIHTSKPNPTYDEHGLIDRRYVVGCEFHNHPI